MEMRRLRISVSFHRLVANVIGVCITLSEVKCETVAAYRVADAPLEMLRLRRICRNYSALFIV